MSDQPTTVTERLRLSPELLQSLRSPQHAEAPRTGRAEWTRSVEPLFLVGVPRSGTTWLQSMLASHPLIQSGPESQFFAAFQHADKDFCTEKGWCGLRVFVTPEQFYGLMAETFWGVVSALPEPPSQPRFFLEKTPHHCMHGDFILRTLPNARILHIVRDGRAVAASLLRAGRTWATDWAPKRAADAAWIWQHGVSTGRAIAEMVPNPEQYLEVQYETLRADPDAGMRHIFTWLDLPADEQTVRRAVDANEIETARRSAGPFDAILATQYRLPQERMGSEQIGPAPVSADRAELSVVQRAVIDHVAGGRLRELGYPF